MIFYYLAYGCMAAMAAGVAGAVWFEELNKKRKKNSIRYKKWLNYRPCVIDVKWEEVE